MALFDISQCEKSEILEWTNTAKNEINSNIALKGLLYEFDFFNDSLVGNPKRFRWIDSHAQIADKDEKGFNKIERNSDYCAEIRRFSCSTYHDDRETGANVEDLFGE